jgi:hypothetical protein
MKLSEKQQLFTHHIGMLIMFAYARGYKLTQGHAWRSPEEQERLYNEGKSKIKSGSNHEKRLAKDFNFFIDGELTYKKEDIQELGDYWEGLNPGVNRWGGNFKSFLDTPHFEAHY